MMIRIVVLLGMLISLSAQAAWPQGKVPGYLGSRFNVKVGTTLLPVSLFSVAPKYDSDERDINKALEDESHLKFMLHGELEWVATNKGSIVAGWKNFRSSVSHYIYEEVNDPSTNFGQDTRSVKTLATSSNNVFSLGWRHYPSGVPAPLGSYFEFTALWGNGTVDMLFPDGRTQEEAYDVEDWGEITWLGGEIKFGMNRIYLDHLVLDYGGHVGFLTPISSSVDPEIPQFGFMDSEEEPLDSRSSEFFLQYLIGFRVAIGYLP